MIMPAYSHKITFSKNLVVLVAVNNSMMIAEIEKKGVKLSWLASETGITIYALSNMVNGKRKITADELFKISKALKVSPEIFEPEET